MSENVLLSKDVYDKLCEGINKSIGENKGKKDKSIENISSIKNKIRTIDNKIAELKAEKRKLLKAEKEGFKSLKTAKAELRRAPSNMYYLTDAYSNDSSISYTKLKRLQRKYNATK